MDNETPTVLYGDMLFERKCPKCGRFVKPDDVLNYEKNGLDDYKFELPNATCAKCGQVVMVFLGFY